MLSKRLIRSGGSAFGTIGRSISHSEVSSANSELVEAVERWRTRDLSPEPIQYLFVDGVNFHMRMEGSIEIIPVLVAIGVTELNHKLVLGLQSGDKESASNWREFFKDLKARGLDAHKVTLGVMDGLPGACLPDLFPLPRGRAGFA